LWVEILDTPLGKRDGWRQMLAITNVCGGLTGVFGGGGGRLAQALAVK